MDRERGEERKAVAAYVLDRLETECRAERGRASQVAKVTGFSTAHIANVRKKERGIGDDFARAMARMWGFESYAALETEALRWVREHPDAVPDDRHPRRTEAARLCREAGVPEEAIRRVLVEPVAPEDESRPTLWWADRMRYAQLRLLEPDERDARKRA